MLDNSLIRYLLDLQVLIDPKQIQEEKVKTIDFPEQEKKKNRVDEKFKSWAIYRSQNCLESWHKCNITNPGKTIS